MSSLPSSYRRLRILTDGSTYFRNMPQFDTALNGDSPKEPIDININQEDLALILQLHEIDAPATLEWSSVAAAMKAAERYGFLMLPAQVAAKAHKWAHQSPFEVFVFASQHDFFALAKLAVSFFYNNEKMSYTPPCHFMPETFKDVSGTYVSALYRAIGPRFMSEYVQSDAHWTEIAGAFRL
jgi:hypothetical protein